MAKHKIKIPNGTQIQTILFDKAYYPSVKQVKQWLHLWGFPLPGKNLHETEDNYRVRQGQPEDYELGSFRTIILTEGIKAVIAKKKSNNPGLTQGEKYFLEILPVKVGSVPEHVARKFLDLNKIYIDSKGYYQVKKKKNSAVRLTNPIHFPKSKAGRPRKRGRPSKAKHHKIFSRGRKPHVTWWVLDLYNRNDQCVKTLIGQGDKDQAKMEAQKFVKGSIYRVELCGPYYFKPSKDVVRK